MTLTEFQKIMKKERKIVIKKFQKKYQTSESKEKVLSNMQTKDIEFLIYCSDNIYANIFYSKFIKKDKM